MKEDKKENKVVNRKWISLVGFIISIGLLLTAIILSANEEKITREARISKNEISTTSIEQASSELTRSINEIKGGTLNQMMENEVTENITAEDDKQTSSETIGNTLNNKTINDDTTNENKQTNSSAENEDKQANTNTENQKQETPKENETKSNEKQEQFIRPIEGEQITNYSMESLIYSNTLQEWMTHRGIDIQAEKTTVVKASASGTIKSIKEDPRYGLSITIEHSNGFQTVYSSLLSTEFVKEGDTVEQGQSIGTVGNSAVFESADGSHLHFEILKDGEYVNPDIYIK